MTFAVPAEAYDRFIGRYSREIAPRFLSFVEVAALSRGPVLELLGRPRRGFSLPARVVAVRGRV